jgi:hypothetical protein
VDEYTGERVGHVDYKIFLVTLQLISCTLSEVYGLRFISELNREDRGIGIVVPIVIAEITLILLGAVPLPCNPTFMFANGISFEAVGCCIFVPRASAVFRIARSWNVD